MSRVSVSLAPEQREQLEASLTPSQYRQAIFQIVTRTTNRVAKIVKDIVRDQTYLKVKYVNRAITIKKPEGDPPTGIVVVRKQPIPLIGFKVSASKRGGVKARIRDDWTIQLKHGFLARVAAGDDSEHQGVFTRAKDPMSIGATRIGKNGRPLRSVTPSGFAERLPINEAYGPNVPNLVDVPQILSQIEFNSREYMAAQTQSQLARFLKRQPIQTAPTDES